MKLRIKKTAAGRYLTKSHGKEYIIKRDVDVWDVFQVLSGAAIRVSTESKKSDAVRMIQDDAYENVFSDRSLSVGGVK